MLILSQNNYNGNRRGQLSIYTKDGALVRTVQLDTLIGLPWIHGITVTMEGQFAVTNVRENKVHVLQL